MSQPCPPGARAARRFPRPLPALLGALLSLPSCDAGPRPAVPPSPPPAPSANTAPSPSPAPSSHDRMVALLAEVRDRTKDENEYQGDFKVRDLRARLAALPPGAPLRERWEILAHLGEGEVLLGREREGVALLEEAFALLPRVGAELPPEWPMELTFRLGTAWMRVAETENCCASDSPDACLLPIRGGGIHAKPEGARRALDRFLEVIEGTPADSVLHLKARWLAAVAAQTLGEHPGAIPPEHRLPPGAFESPSTFPRFPNVAARAGLATFSLSGGAAAEDYDGDGDLDLLVSTAETSRNIRYWRNGGDGTFSDRTAEAHLEGILGGLNLVQGDVDGDGDTDVVVLRGAWFGRGGRHPNSLLRNRGNGVFDDVALDAGIGDARLPTQSAAFADADNDGDLDLFVANETAFGLDAPCEFHRNRGDGTFVESAREARLLNGGFTKGCAWGDFDGDGWMDLYVSNLGGPNRLYRNNRDGTFEDVAPRRGVTGPLGSFPCWVFDFDQDGNHDVFVGGYPAGPADAAAHALGIPPGGEIPRLYRGDGRGGFEEVGRALGLTRAASPMGCNFGDFDNDGYPDFLLGTGNTTMWDLIPNLAYRNDRGRRFEDVTIPGGFGHLQKGHGIVFADLDDDGDQDVFSQMGGAFLGDRFDDALYENPGFGNRWLALRLRGVKANRSAIGARVRAEILDGGVLRTVHGTVSSGGSFGANPLRLHLGLGKAERVETLSITWPGSGTRQVLRGVPADREVTVTEGEDRWVERTLRPVRLGGGAR